MNPDAMDAAIISRRSTRAFTQRAVAQEALAAVLAAATQVPSGATVHPWKVHVLQGASRESLCDKVCAAHDAMRADVGLTAHYREPYDYYPAKWVSPYIDRRRENGWSLYALLGIGKADKDKMHAQHQRNYRFFDAPVGLMLTLHQAYGPARLLEYGMFVQNIMLAARDHGLHTCPQAAWQGFSRVVLPHIGAGSEEMLVCGMALGYADEGALVNTFHTPRLPLPEFAYWPD